MCTVKLPKSNVGSKFLCFFWCLADEPDTKNNKKTFQPWWFLWQQRVLNKAVHKGKKGDLLPSSMPDGTSCFDNRHLMFSYSSIDQLINSNEAWTASEIFKRSFHWSTASSGNEKIFNNDRGECARINLEKCGQLQLIEYNTVQCVWQLRKSSDP